MRRIKKIVNLIIVLALATVMLTACRLGSINLDTESGSCSLNVAFVNIPEQFYSISESVRNEFYITVIIENLITGNEYIIVLNNENGFVYNAKLDPGSYHVKAVYANKSNLTGMIIGAGEDSITLTEESISVLPVIITNLDQFVSFQENLDNTGNIALMSRFSRMLMIDGNLVSMDDLYDCLFSDKDITVKPYSTEKFENEEKGISVVVLNDTGDVQPASQCRVIKIEVTKNTVIFPGAICLGMNVEDVCNKEHGIYGTPSYYSGSALYGLNLMETKACYLDDVSGDRLTVVLSSSGEYISGLIYEYECYE